MDNLKINTSQNVDIENNIASIGERMLAHLLDYTVFFAYFMIMFLITSNSFGFETSVTIILLFPILFYDLVFEYFFDGQSIGKKITRIKVVKLNGAPASFGNYVIRWLFRIIDNLLIFGSVSTITLIFNGKGQRLGDIAAGTTIIKLSSEVSLEDAVFVSTPENYNPLYPSAKLLTEKDIETIKEVVKYYKLNRFYSGNAGIAEKTKEAIEKKLNIKSNQFALSFFESLLMDYSHFNK